MDFQSEMAKKAYEHYDLELVRTVSRVPGNPNYYEKDGLRTYGDGQDHDTDPPMTFSRVMALIAMGFLWCGSQIPLYLFGTVIPIIMGDIGGADRYVWILLGTLMPLASITPFVGALSDMFGRKWVAIFGAVNLVVGSIVCGTAKDMNILIGGQVLVGIGAGINELTALAVAAELAPTRKRGLYVGAIICTILPYAPSALWSQLVSYYGSWRYLGLWCGLWNFIGLALTFVFFNPPPRVNSLGLSRMEVAKRIDYVGGVLAAGCLTLFLMALTWSGNQYSWGSPHVLVCMILGIVMCIGFGVWEAWFAPWPMFPKRLGQNPRALTIILIITCVSGANFFAVLVFWPTQYQFIWGGDDPIQNGLGSLPVGFCIIGGAIICSVLISLLKSHIRIIMVVACIVMTAGNGAMAAVTINNLHYIYIAVTFACLGVGAVIIPNQIIASIVCPDDLIGSATALTLSVRIVGGSIGYAVYYNVLRQRFTVYATKYIGPVCVFGYHIFSIPEITQIAELVAANDKKALLSQFPQINESNIHYLITAGQKTYAASFPVVYYISIAFGALTIIAACFMPDVSQFMDGHVAVEYM